MTAARAVSRALHVEHCMGTVFTLDVRDPGDWSVAIAAAVAGLHRDDEVFSTYRADSELSRIRRGELRVADAAADVADVLDLCAGAQADADGAFSALLGGSIDPTGLVKGWAIERAAAVLRGHGATRFAVNGGGDITLSGAAEPGRAWGVGIADPLDRTRVIAVVESCGGAVATSGVAERGLHITDPATGERVVDVASASVVGPDLALADAYATAAVV